MALYDLDGTATGSGSLTGGAGIITAVGGSLVGSSDASAPAIPTHEFGGTLLGAAAVTGSAVRVLMFSGNPQGAGDLIDGTLLTVSGQAVGAGTIIGQLVRVRDVSAYAGGAGNFFVSIPEPIYGTAIVTAFMDVIRVPAPACHTCPTSEFRWMQQFQNGDLGICITDNLGNPIGPVCVSYTMYQVVRGCVLHQVGPTRSCPASSGVGKFYVTGTAGEGGQPGVWVVRWRFQKTFGAPAIERDLCFQVLDAVTGPVPGDTTQRACKYGWD